MDYKEQFIKEIKNLQPSKTDSTEWWDDIRNDIIAHVQNNDVDTWWDWIKGGMWSGPFGYNSLRLPPLQASPEWKSRWLPVLYDGLPSSVHLQGASSTAIGHAARLLRFEQITKSRIENYDFIFEYGAGYGSLARIITQLGFKGEYVIHDLPELMALQRMYLGERNIPVTYTDNHVIVPPRGKLSLIISLHAADESKMSKCTEFANCVRYYDAMFVTSGNNPKLWENATSLPVLTEPIPGPSGNYYIVSPKR